MTLRYQPSCRSCKVGYRSVWWVAQTDYCKIAEQRGDGDEVIEKSDCVFAQNGTLQYKYRRLLSKLLIENLAGGEPIQNLISFRLCYMALLRQPKKRGTVIEFQNATLTISPICHSCTLEERIEFYEQDKKENIGEKSVVALETKFDDKGLRFSRGGMINVDVFPEA